MILFTPADHASLEPDFVRAVTAQREAYAKTCQAPYSPPGSDLARGILSRSPLATQLFELSAALRRFPSEHCLCHIAPGLLAACVDLQVALAVSFQGQQMTVLLAAPQGNQPFPVTLSFRPTAAAKLRNRLQDLKGLPANVCFGGDAYAGFANHFYYNFPVWQMRDLSISRPHPALAEIPCDLLLNLILCCEVGYCPARFFQLLGLSAHEALETVSDLPQDKAADLRNQLERLLPAPFAPPPAPTLPPARAYTTYADLAGFLKQYHLLRKDLALALHLAPQALARTDHMPLPQPFLEIIAYAQTHSHTALRQELLRRAGPEHACTLWSADDLRDFRERYKLPQSRLKVLLSREVLYLSQWENATADIPFSVCKALDKLQDAFRRVFPEVEDPAFND
ncbi:MAG: hypothetical protein ACI4RT_06155 [Candidatus Spyradenecus sp.]